MVQVEQAVADRSGSTGRQENGLTAFSGFQGVASMGREVEGEAGRQQVIHKDWALVAY